MKRCICLFAAVLLLFSTVALTSCDGKYDAIEPTEDDLRVVGVIEKYNILYDELRCSVMNAKSLMADSYGLDWSNSEDAAKYSEELYRRVFSGLKYNYAVQILLLEGGYTLDNANIQASVQDAMKKLIDECGSRSKYKKYLNDNYLTDRVVRLNYGVSLAVNELVYIMNDSGSLDEYINFDLESITYGDIYFKPEDYAAAMELLFSGKMLLYTEHIYIPDSLENAGALAESLYGSAQAGEKLSSLAEASADGVVCETLYQVKGERDENYYNSATELDENELSLLHTGNGYYIIRKLSPDMSYVTEHSFSLIYSYVSIIVNEKIEAYAKTLELTLSEFGQGLDFTQMK